MLVNILLDFEIGTINLINSGIVIQPGEKINDLYQTTEVFFSPRRISIKSFSILLFHDSQNS